MAVNIDFHDYSNTNDPVWPKQEEVGLFLVLFNTYFAQSMKLDKFVDSGAMAFFQRSFGEIPKTATENKSEGIAERIISAKSNPFYHPIQRDGIQLWFIQCNAMNNKQLYFQLQKAKWRRNWKDFKKAQKTVRPKKSRWTKSSNIIFWIHRACFHE